jgi:hypothetical protein
MKFWSAYENFDDHLSYAAMSGSSGTWPLLSVAESDEDDFENNGSKADNVDDNAEDNYDENRRERSCDDDDNDESEADIDSCSDVDGNDDDDVFVSMTGWVFRIAAQVENWVLTLTHKYLSGF